MSDESSVEKKYLAAMHSMTGTERVGRALRMYDFVHQMLELKISRENPDFSPRRVKIEIAKRMYLSDPAIQAVLQRLQDEHERTTRDS
jgi:hypothetical protein